MNSTNDQKRKRFIEELKKKAIETGKKVESGKTDIKLFGKGISFDAIYIGERKGKGSGDTASRRIDVMLCNDFSNVKSISGVGVYIDSGKYKMLKKHQKPKDKKTGKYPPVKILGSSFISIGDTITVSSYEALLVRNDGKELEPGDLVTIEHMALKISDNKTSGELANKDMLGFYNAGKIFYDPSKNSRKKIIRKILGMSFEKIRFLRFGTLVESDFSPEENRFKWQKMFFCNWKTSEDIFEKDSGMAIMDISYRKDKWLVTYKKNEIETTIKKVIFDMTVSQWETLDKLEQFLIQVDVSAEAVNDFGINDLKTWEAVAPFHIPHMKFVVRTFFDLSDTAKSPTNSTGDDLFILSFKALQVFVDLEEYLRNHCLRVNRKVFDIIWGEKKSFVEYQNTSTKSAFNDKSPDRKNLTELYGPLDPYTDDKYDFFIMAGVDIDQKTLNGDATAGYIHFRQEIADKNIAYALFAVKKEHQNGTRSITA